MATAEETEASINDLHGGTGSKVCDITHDFVRDGTYSDYYVNFHPTVTGGTGLTSKSMWIRVTTSDSAILQRATILAALGQDGNVDPNVGP